MPKKFDSFPDHLYSIPLTTDEAAKKQCLFIVENLLEKYGYVLNLSGLFYKTHEMAKESFTAEIIDAYWYRLQRVIKIIPFLVIRTNHKGLVGSYGLKHSIEKYTVDTGISNGEAILIMFLLGYGAFRETQGTSPNLTFKCKYVKSDATIDCVKIHSTKMCQF